MKEPQTLLEAIRLYKDPEVAEKAFADMRWPIHVACPRRDCGSADVARLEKYRRWYCKDCKRQFSAKTGTIFEDSPVGFDKWLPAMWLLSANRNGISSCELARSLGVTQKTAWFMLHRIRLAMTAGNFEQIVGEVEIDETFVGPKARSTKRRGPKANGGKGPAANKTTVLGFRQRGGIVRAFVVRDVRRTTLLPTIREHVAPGAIVYTDALKSYHDVKFGWKHHIIDHAVRYVEGTVHTNSIESFWSVLKRTLSGTYIAPRPWHLQRYLDEQIFRFNAREEKDGPRFVEAVKGTDGKRVTYRQLTAR